MNSLSNDRNIYVIQEDLNLISVYDDNLYDRSDLDLMNTSMRNYVVNLVKEDGFLQTSGNVLQSPLFDYKIIFPKPSNGLGATPWDNAINTKRNKEDFIVLTPTQVAGFCLEKFEMKKAIKYIEQLMDHHPVNLLKLRDHISLNKKQKFINELPRLQEIANEVRNRTSMKNRSHIGRKI